MIKTKGIPDMSDRPRKTPARVIATRIICGLLALLMLGGVAYTAIVFILS